MVDNVVVDNVVEQHTANPAKVAVNGGEGALDVGPRLGLVVVHLGVVVVEVGDGDLIIQSVYLDSSFTGAI